MSIGKDELIQATQYHPYEIRLPDENGLAQDQEWCEVRIDNAWRRVRFHDYHEIYQVPGLYEHLFYQTLKCCSPQRVAELLADALEDQSEDFSSLKVLDVGAGNGMVGEVFKAMGASRVVGVDIVPEAKTAALRDRPGIYDRYLVTDLTDLPEPHETVFRKNRLNCLTTVAALGFGDIPPTAFLTALRVTETPAWVAFNIKEDFLSDESEFSRLIRDLQSDGVIRFESYRRYQHRLSITGEPLYYVALIATKLRNVPDTYIEAYSGRRS